MEDVVVDLLWTGGWDSTYRLLDLVFNEQRLVNTYYVLDRGRPSHEKEITVMEQIASAVRARAQVPNCIRGPSVIEERKVAPDQEITSAFRRLAAIEHLGSQYEWLARFARQLDLNSLELCVQRHIHQDSFILRCVKSLQTHGPLTREAEIVFGRFRFPLAELTKLDMQDRAVESGFDDLLRMSWFCHKGERFPCGRCVPCRIAIEEGLAHRVGWRGRFMNKASVVGRRLLRSTRRPRL